MADVADGRAAMLRSWFRRHGAKALLALLTVAAIYFFADAFLAAWRDGSLRWPQGVSWGWLALSVVVGVLNVAAMGCAFAWLIGAGGQARVGVVFLLSQAAKYVPGKIWGVVMQRALMASHSSLSNVIGANVAMAAVLFAAQVAMAVAALLALRVGLGAGAAGGLLVCVAAGAFAAALQRIHAATGWRILGPWSRGGVGLFTAAASTSSLALSAVAWMALFWGALGYAEADVMRWMAVSGASFIAGMASVLPGGLGLREAAFVALGEQLPTASAADGPMLALVTRGWLLLIDAVSVLLGMVGLVALRTRSRG